MFLSYLCFTPKCRRYTEKSSIGIGLTRSVSRFISVTSSYGFLANIGLKLSRATEELLNTWWLRSTRSLSGLKLRNIACGFGAKNCSAYCECKLHGWSYCIPRIRHLHFRFMHLHLPQRQFPFKCSKYLLFNYLKF